MTQEVRSAHKIVEANVHSFLGTSISKETPLVSAGLDSISATELTRVLSEQLGVDLPATLLFDHPTMSTVAAFVEMSTNVEVLTHLTPSSSDVKVEVEENVKILPIQHSI